MDDSLKSYIHTPKPQIQTVEPRKGRLGIRIIPCVLWWRGKNQEAFMCFLVFGREKKCVEKLGKEQNSETKWAPLVEVAALGISKGLDFRFLKRYGTWKSNGRIKSYGSRKFAVYWSVCHLGFHDISAVLTPISSHEYSLEQEFDNLCNGIGFNRFW